MIIKFMAQQDTISHPSTSVNGYLQFVRSEKIPLLYNSKQPINVFDAIIDVDGRLLPFYALVMADGDTSAVDKAYAGTPAETEQLDEQHHLDCHSGFQLNEAVIF